MENTADHKCGLPCSGQVEHLLLPALKREKCLRNARCVDGGGLFFRETAGSEFIRIAFVVSDGSFERIVMAGRKEINAELPRAQDVGKCVCMLV